MGEVYRGRDTRLDRTIAIKVLTSHLSDNPELKQRFEREAKAISSLNHPHICTLYDVGEHEGIAYLVMEHLEGETLADRVIRGPLKINEALELASDIAEALDKAHHAGIIHRDLKPANIMLTKTGAKLMDFGLAKPVLALATGATGAISPTTPTMSLQALAAPASPLTQKGAIVGTFQYMAPEVFQGAEADARSDIFSFGCVLYEMVTGRRAFEGKSQLSVATAILEKEIEPITSENPNVPAALAQIISTCLAKNPDERFACAHDVNLQLRSIPMRARNVINSVNRTREMLLVAAVSILLIAAGWLGYERWQDAHKAVQVVQSELDIYAADVVDRASGGQISEQFALSPDGRDLAYVSRKAGASGTQLWIRHLNSGTSSVLPGTEGARSPFWSPESRVIGFFSFGRLKTIVLSTQTVTDLCQARFYWGTWGRRDMIVFVGGPGVGLQRIPASGGTPVPIPSTLSGFRPSFLPDGDHFIYLQWQSSDNPDYLLKIGDIDGGHPMDLGIRSSYAVLYASGYLIYSTTGRIVAQRFDSRNLRVTSDPVTLADFGNMTSPPAFPLTASQNGVFVYRRAPQNGDCDVRLFSRDGKIIPSSVPVGFNNNPVISPDGNKIAYDVTSGVTRDVWIYDRKEKSNARLTMGQALSSDPVWSPDGKRIALSVEDQSKFRVVIMDIDGGRTETVYETTYNSVWVRSWSPDGKLLFVDYYNAAGKRSIGVLSLTEHTLTELNSGAEAVSQRSINISPDGRWIAYVTDQSGHEEVYIQAYPGPGKRVQVSYGGGYMPRWRGDGREIYYVSGESIVTAVPVQYPNGSIDVGNRQELFKVNPLYPGGNPLSVSRDRKLFVVNSVGESTASPVRMIMNWSSLVEH